MDKMQKIRLEFLGIIIVWGLFIGGFFGMMIGAMSDPVASGGIKVFCAVSMLVAGFCIAGADPLVSIIMKKVAGGK